MKSNEEKVLEVFFDNPTEKFHIREIARMTELNPNTVLNISQQLIKKGLLKKEKKKHVVELSAVSGEKFRIYKRINNLKRVYDSGILNFLKEKFSPEALVLIGSYSMGEDVRESDIDIVIISKKQYESINLSNFEKKLNRKIHPIITYYNKMSSEFYINLINGVVLEGAVRKK